MVPAGGGVYVHVEHELYLQMYPFQFVRLVPPGSVNETAKFPEPKEL